MDQINQEAWNVVKKDALEIIGKNKDSDNFFGGLGLDEDFSKFENAHEFLQEATMQNTKSGTYAVVLKDSENVLEFIAKMYVLKEFQDFQEKMMAGLLKKDK